MFRRILSSAERETIEKARREKLTEFARFFNGTADKPNVAPILPMNRFRFSRTSSSKVKAASNRTSPNNRIILHPERVQRDRKLAELAHLIKGN